MDTGGASSQSSSFVDVVVGLEGAFVGETFFFDDESMSLNGCVIFEVSNVMVIRPSCSAIDNFK